MIDQAKLLSWIRDHAESHPLPLVSAIYAGLAQRIERGDFEVEGETL